MPPWYHNLTVHPEVPVEIGQRSICGCAGEVHGDERGRLCLLTSKQVPALAKYQRASDRVFPVIVLDGVPAAEPR